MDPNACVDRINLGISIEDWDEVEAGCRDLIEWLGQGGALHTPAIPLNSEDAVEAGHGCKEASAALYQLGRVMGLLAAR
jgi:hypothetical protein